MSCRASMLLSVALAGCVLSPELVAQLGGDETGESTETGDAPPPDCFEGSSCHQQCLTGDCVMDCHDSVECGLDCLGETPCSLICENTSNCHMNCPFGNCTMFCIGSVCTIDQCSGGCTIFCDLDSACSASCADPMACLIETF